VSKLPKQTSRKDLIKRFKQLGYSGPHRGTGKHPEFMMKDGQPVKIPNEHRGGIGEVLLKRVLANAGISIEDWLP